MRLMCLLLYLSTLFNIKGSKKGIYAKEKIGRVIRIPRVGRKINFLRIKWNLGRCTQVSIMEKCKETNSKVQDGDTWEVSEEVKLGDTVAEGESPAPNVTNVHDGESYSRVQLTNILLIADYDGTQYNGWTGIENSSEVYLNAVRSYKNVMRRSKGRGDEYPQSTIQNCILDCLLKLHGYEQTNMHSQKLESDLKPFNFIGVSRTDKGVHAKEYICQYISYEKKPPCNGDMKRIKQSLNRMLNRDIKILGVCNTPSPHFNIRFHNYGKIYSYNLDVRIPSQPIERNYAWQLYDDPRFSFLLKGEKINRPKDQTFLFANSLKEMQNGNSASMLSEEKITNRHLLCTNSDGIRESSSSFSHVGEGHNKKCNQSKQENEEGQYDLITDEFGNVQKEKEEHPYEDITHCLRIMRKDSEMRSSINCDMYKIKECSKLFIGSHDFQYFRGTLKGTERLRKVNTICNIHFIDVYEVKNNLYQFVIQGDRFLYHMIRIIVGTLVQVGVGLLDMQDVRDALRLLKPLKVKLCAPAQGLCLNKVLLPPAVQTVIDAAILSS
ncbi:tRNA pseudouridine synthase, putative [Plasmodium ovale]|uniref:tRNA pseudouridine synthase, putative n=1 Tax=Plasmodium ovale TaxID=36330 RepID=A0A1C3KI03_PLAOA|nr:tRNA pseudouridine synthase, putative [Plasmodium ovale]